VGWLGVLSAKQMGAKRLIAMSRHASRQKLAREFGATDIVTERGNEGRPAGSSLRNLGASLVPRCRDKKNVYLPMLEVLSKGGGRESRANLSPPRKRGDGGLTSEYQRAICANWSKAACKSSARAAARCCGCRPDTLASCLRHFLARDLSAWDWCRYALQGGSAAFRKPFTDAVGKWLIPDSWVCRKNSSTNT